MRLDLVVSTLVFGGMAAWWLAKGWRVRTAQSWPKVEGTFEVAEVIHRPAKSAPTFESSSRWVCSLQYVYIVNGECWPGELKYVFSSETLAARLAEQERGRTVTVHYNPQNPTVGILDQKDLDRLNRAASGLNSQVLAK